MPIGDKQIYWFASVKAKPEDLRLRQYSKADTASVFSNYHHPVTELIYATADKDIVLHNIYDLKPIPRYAFGHAVLIGDAAHATTPNMGQGACQAIEDAVVLAHTLKTPARVDEAFKIFEQKRIERTHYIVNQSWKFGKLAQMENGFFGEIRNFLFRSIPERIYQKQLEKVYDFSSD